MKKKDEFMGMSKFYWTMLFCLAVIVIMMTINEMSRTGVIGTSADDMKINIVSGTEYAYGDVGQIIVEMRDRNLNIVTNITCYATILYENKTYFVNTVPMNVSPLGTQFYQFIVPDSTGVYEYLASCVRGNKTYSNGKSFHVSSRGEVQSWITP